MVDVVSLQIAACMNASSGLVHHSNEPNLSADPERVVNVRGHHIVGFKQTLNGRCPRPLCNWNGIFVLFPCAFCKTTQTIH